MSVKYADRTKEMQASEIRESYKLMGIPGMISMRLQLFSNMQLQTQKQ